MRGHHEVALGKEGSSLKNLKLLKQTGGKQVLSEARQLRERRVEPGTTKGQVGTVGRQRRPAAPKGIQAVKTNHHLCRLVVRGQQRATSSSGPRCVTPEPPPPPSPEGGLLGQCLPGDIDLHLRLSCSPRAPHLRRREGPPVTLCRETSLPVCTRAPRHAQV